MDIKYRKARAEDIPTIVELRMRFLEELIQESYDVEAYKNDLTTYFIRSFNDKSLYVYLAAHENKIIATSAMVHWYLPIGFSGIGKNGVGYILNMYTEKEYRKKGIAGSLLDKLLALSKELNLEKVHLHATEDGKPLYLKKGFFFPKYKEMVLKIK